LPLKIAVRKNDSDNEEHLYKHDVLSVLKNPNPFMSKTTFWESIVLSLLLPSMRGTGGQCFLIPTTLEGYKVNLRKGEIPEAFYPYSEDWITPIVDNGNLYWKWKNPDGNEKSEMIIYEPDELIRIFNYNPYDPFGGLAPYIPVKWAVKQDAEASLFNYNFFKNNATLSGILSTDAILSQEQAQQVTTRFQDLYTGSNKAGKVAVLGNGLKFQEMSRTHIDMQFSEMKNINKHEIISAYGLNEIAFGDISSIPYSNLIEGLKMLWTETYLPIQEHICESINAQWVRYIKPEETLSVEADTSEIQALKSDLEQKVKIASMMITQCQTPIAEAFRIVGIDLDTDKYPYMKEKPTINALPVQASAVESAKAIKKQINKEVDIKRNDAIWENHIKNKIAIGEKNFYNMFTKFFAQQRNQILDNIDTYFGKDKSMKKASDDEALEVSSSKLLFDLTQENKKLEALYLPILKKQMLKEAEHLNAELPKGLVEWNVNPDNIDAMMSARAKYVEGLNTENFNLAKDVIKEQVEIAIKEGYTTNELAKNIKDAIKETYDKSINNSNTIARTETNAISSQTRFDAFEKEGIEYQEWVSARDMNVRESHQIDGEIVKVGQSFSNGLAYPLDKSGAPEDVINCRCICVYAEKP
jgi:HK97 family phage portal protein